MTDITLISKGGDVSTIHARKLKASDIYKKCKFRDNVGFSKQHTWKDGDTFVSIYAKSSGRAGMVNKYDLPPPVDTVLFFGNMVVLRHKNKEPADNEWLNIKKEEWGTLYDKLFGGFETLGDEDSESEDAEEIPEELKSKQGYSKEDNFIVEDDDPILMVSGEEEEEEGEYISSGNSSDSLNDGGDSDEGDEDDEDDGDDEDGEDDEDSDSELDEEDYSYK
jgi:hypothetical protein